MKTRPLSVRLTTSREEFHALAKMAAILGRQTPLALAEQAGYKV
jgi:hypothetical protein